MIEWRAGYRSTPEGITEVVEGLILKSDYEWLAFQIASLERENKSLRERDR
jgi:hypothetical protein